MADYTIQDRRTDEEREATQGFVIATDHALSGFGMAVGGRSIVAVAFQDYENEKKVYETLLARREMKRVRIVYSTEYKPKMQSGDHLSIYGFNDFRTYQYN